MTGNDSGKCVLDALKLIDIFLSVREKKRVGKQTSLPYSVG